MRRWEMAASPALIPKIGTLELGSAGASGFLHRFEQSRLRFGVGLVTVGVIAWRKAYVRVAVLFLAMLVCGMGAMFIVHQRWIRGF